MVALALHRLSRELDVARLLGEQEEQEAEEEEERNEEEGGIAEEQVEDRIAGAEEGAVAEEGVVGGEAWAGPIVAPLLDDALAATLRRLPLWEAALEAEPRLGLPPVDVPKSARRSAYASAAAADSDQ